LNAYKENWAEIVKQLGELRDEMATGRKEEPEGISIIEAPFYDYLKNNLVSASETDIEKTKELIHSLMGMIKETANITNFWTDKASERKRISGLLEDEIHYSKIDGISNKAAELTTELMKLAKNREGHLR
jgi:hypothetical protein